MHHTNTVRRFVIAGGTLAGVVILCARRGTARFVVQDEQMGKDQREKNAIHLRLLRKKGNSSLE
jgi:hypothetical protein